MKIARITIAITNMPEMVAFYNSVCDANLISQPPFYRGEIAGIDVLFCPNEIAGVEAKQNRQQFRFEFDDLHTVLDAVRQNGGVILNEETENGSRLVGVRDPDGNTIEVIGR